jgi:hypothetical protein
MQKTLLKNQRGIALITELMLVLMISSVLLTLYHDRDQNQRIEESAEEIGTRLAQYNSAVQRWIAFNPSPGNTTKYGVTWLKPTSCGGNVNDPASGFLDCDFPASTKYGQTYRTSITYDSVIGVVKCVSTLSRPTRPIANKPLQYYGTFAAEIAVAAISQPSSLANPVSGMFADYTPNPGLTIASATLANAAFGTVQAVASNAGSSDAWLRTDGSNMMKADLNGGGKDAINFDNLNANEDVNAGQNITAMNGHITAENGDLRATGNIITTAGVVYGEDMVIDRAILSTNYRPRASQAVYEVKKVRNEDTVSAPTCPNFRNPLIFATPHSFPTRKAYDTNNTARTINYIHPQATASGNPATSWRIRTRMMDENGTWRWMAANQVELEVIVKCP